MGAQDFAVQLVAEFVSAFKPLVDALESEEAIDAFLGEFGWQLGASATKEQVQLILGDATKAANDAQVLADSLLNAFKENRSPDLSDFSKTVNLVTEIVNTINLILDNQYATFHPFMEKEFQHNFPAELLQYLVYTYVSWRMPRFFGLFYVLGVFREGSPKTDRDVEYSLRETHWEMLATLASAPQDVLHDAYDWGEAKFGDDGQKKPGNQAFIEALIRFFTGFSLPVIATEPSLDELNLYYAPDSNYRKNILKLDALLYQILQSSAGKFSLAHFDLDALPVPSKVQKSDPPSGISIYPHVEGELQGEMPLAENVKLALQGSIAASGIYLEFYPSTAGVTLKPNVPVEGKMALTGERPADKPWVLAGRRESTHLWMSKLHLGMEAHGTLPEIEVVLEGGIDALGFVLDFGESDGFLKKFFGEKPQRIDLSVVARWSKNRGFSLTGKLALEFNIALHQSIGEIIQLESILIRLGASDKANDQQRPLLITFALTGSLRLGPIAGSVDRVGIEAAIKFPKNGGNLGPADLDLHFKPPNGLGMVLDARVIVGGGYIMFDDEKKQYAGILQLEIQSYIAIKAIGLLTTRLPDGSKGFSLLILLTAEFPPIQLGYGFALTGLGGLLGLNRTMMLDVLRSGIKNHTLDSILFPKDPIANAPKIISDLQSVFPPVNTRFVIGPMAKIGWASPPRLTIELGIVLEIPSPIRLAIMGVLKAALPDEKAAVIHLRMDVLGTIDFEKGEAAVDASIYDSQVAQFAITGDMALRLNWGASPTFLLSAGGYHPRFQPPPNFPTLERLAISLANSDNPRLRLDSYFAVTTNTVQFGAHLDAYASIDLGKLVGRFSAQAYLGCDTIIHFSPFSFVVDIDGSVAINRNDKPLLAASIHLTLSGPQPWHAMGEVNFEIAKTKHRIPIDLTAGDEAPAEPLPLSDPLKDLRNAIADKQNWSAQLPMNGQALTTLRAIPPGEQTPEVLMHPFGELTFRQKVVPLNIPISKYGNTSPSSTGPFQFSEVTFNGQALPSLPPNTRDLFPRGEYFAMSDEEALAGPEHEALPSGISKIATNETTFSPVRVSANLGYTTVVIDKMDLGISRAGAKYFSSPGVILANVRLGASGQAILNSSGSAKFAGDKTQQVKIKDTEYVVASTDTLSWTMVHPTYTEAQAARNQQYGTSSQAQVLARHEVA